jgi:hypothetical protein
MSTRYELAILAIMQANGSSKRKVESLISEIVTSYPFLNRRVRE